MIAPDRVAELAREAGIRLGSDPHWQVSRLQRFAALIEAETRADDVRICLESEREHESSDYNIACDACAAAIERAAGAGT